MKNVLILLLKNLTNFLIKIRLLNPLVIVRMDGGIASQMHFYLVGMLFKEKGYKVKFDLSWFQSDGHDLEGKHVRNFDLLKAFPYLEFKEISWVESFLFAGFKYVNNNKGLDFLEKKPPIWLLSYYPYTNYMLDVMMQNYFKITPSCLDEHNLRFYQLIKEKKCPVAVHVRRGDLSSFNPAYGEPVPNNYFSNAIAYIIGQNKDPFFFFFSDETQWVRDVLIPVLGLPNNFIIVEGNGSDKGYMDMFLIAACKYQITSKGSLGKYGGFIHPDNDNKIIIYDDKIEKDKWGGLSDRLIFISAKR